MPFLSDYEIFFVKYNTEQFSLDGGINWFHPFSYFPSFSEVKESCYLLDITMILGTMILAELGDISQVWFKETYWYFPMAL